MIRIQKDEIMYTLLERGRRYLENTQGSKMCQIWKVRNGSTSAYSVALICYCPVRKQGDLSVRICHVSGFNLPGEGMKFQEVLTKQKKRTGTQCGVILVCFDLGGPIAHASSSIPSVY